MPLLHRFFFISVVAAGLALPSARTALADDLAKLVQSAKGKHVPLTDSSFAAVREDLQSTARRLENRLGMGSTFAAGWKAYLKWDLLEPHFSDDVKISGQSLRDLDSVLRRLRSNKPGLEHPVFVRTAEALERYRELAFWYALGQRRDTRPRYDSFLSELEKQLTRNLEKPTVESTRQIGKVVGLIHQLGHSPDLVQQISNRFSRPNVNVQVSEAALEQFAKRPVNDASPVWDCILGARVIGKSQSTGVLGLKTLPAHDHIAVELQLAGNIQSQTFSYKKPVRVGSLGSTNFAATKHLEISDERFLVLPALASAKTSSRTTSINKTGGKFGRRLVEKIARKKVAKSKPQANWIAARHAEQRIADKFDDQVVDVVYEARQNYDRKLHPPLERIGMFPDFLNMTSTAEGIHVETKLASYKQISTHLLPPGSRSDNDLTFQVHDSAINNMLPHLLAGLKLQQDDASEPPRMEGDVPPWLKKLGKDPKVQQQFVEPANPPELADQPVDQQSVDQQLVEADDFKPWSMQLNAEHPVSVSFEDQQATIRIRIAELKTLEDEEESVRKNWDFLVTYDVVQDGNGVKLRRAGDIEALPTGFDPLWFGDPRWQDQLTGAQAGIRTILEDNINARAADGGGFPLEIPLPPIDLPSNSGAKQRLLLQQLECDNGWLTLGYRLP